MATVASFTDLIPILLIVISSWNLLCDPIDYKLGDCPPVPSKSIFSSHNIVASFQIPHVDWIKIYVEGAEMLVLLGARETITRFRPALVISGSRYYYQE
ncbi:MAG: FkbM family methyltransferase [Thermoproteota archaeon]|nr:FkbM family methyltransferase [Thermoproteota archaeon]